MDSETIATRRCRATACYLGQTLFRSLVNIAFTVPNGMAFCFAILLATNAFSRFRVRTCRIVAPGAVVSRAACLLLALSEARLKSTPKAIQDLFDELEASKQSRLRAWKVLQKLRAVLSENGHVATTTGPEDIRCRGRNLGTCPHEISPDSERCHQKSLLLGATVSLALQRRKWNFDCIKRLQIAEPRRN